MYQKADPRSMSADKPMRNAEIFEVSKEKSTPLKPKQKKRSRTSEKKAKNVRFSNAKT